MEVLNKAQKQDCFSAVGLDASLLTGVKHLLWAC